MISIDYLLFYGDVDLQEEIEKDIMALITQPKGSLFYGRDEGSDIPNHENLPSSAVGDIMTKFYVQDFLSTRNMRTTDGSIDGKNRRVAVSQEFISLQRKQPGEIDVNVYYIPLATLQGEVLQFPLKGVV